MQAIGYIRISTNLKRQNEQSLERQAMKIKEACLAENFELSQIYEDIGSACSADSLKHRPGLRDALHTASVQGSIIVASDTARLFRNLPEALKIRGTYPNVLFWTISNRSFLTNDLFRSTVSAAVAEAEAIRIGTSKAQIARGFTGPNHEAKLRGSRKSLMQRKSRAANRIEDLADILERHEQSRLLTNEGAAQLFNAHVVRTSQGREWTKVNVRRDLKSAREVIQERADVLDLLNDLNLAA